MCKLWHCKGMKRNLFFIVLCFSLFCVTTIFAADIVPLRISEKDGYDRVVFGLKNTAEYTLRTEEGHLIIKFNIPAQTTDEISEVDNIGALKILSNTPLEVSFEIPKSSKVRDFKIGKRVVLDIYDPTNPEDKLQKTKETSPQKEAPPVPVEKPQQTEAKDEPVTQPVKKQEPPKLKAKPEPEKKADAEKTETPQPSPLPANPPAFVLVPETLTSEKQAQEKPETNTSHEKSGEKQEKPNENAALKKAVNQENHVISVRSTTNLGMAAFRFYDDLWLIIDNNASLVMPNLSTAKPDLFGNFERVMINDANAYKIRMPSDEKLNIMGQGVGLTWDLIMGDKVKSKIPPEPIYQNESAVLFPLYAVSKILETEHPDTGERIIIVTADEARQFGAYKQTFIEFSVLYSPIGLAILPKVDDLKVSQTSRGIIVSRPQGLALSSATDKKAAEIFVQQSSEGDKDHKDDGHGRASKEDTNLYKFSKWKLGKSIDLTKNQNILLEAFPDKSEGKRVEDLITLGKMMLSHGLAAEAIGYFEFARDELPGLEESAEFKALRGAALALDWKSEDAVNDLLHKSLRNEKEVQYWAAYVLADLKDWQQAASVMPDDFRPIYDYPDYIAHTLALTLAEVSLRAGQVNKAKELLNLVETTDDNISAHNNAELKYLQGEAFRQEGELDKAIEVWKSLSEDDDDLFSVRSKLALTILEANEKKITTDEVIDRLESIRYAWRGDDLEAQIKYWLGKAYFDKDEFVVGLSIMRDAASIAGQTALARKIASDMAQTYLELYLGPKLKDVKPLNALAVYEQFRELTPIGAQGNMLEQNLAEHLVRAQLFERATKMLRHQVDHRLSGEEKLNTAIRLAEIELMDNNPQQAINALSKATSELRRLKESPEKEEKKNEIELLRIRAYAKNKEYDKSLSLLEKLTPDQTVNRLKAGIAWKAGYWEDAAKHLNSVIIDENLTPESKLNQEQAELILNRAIALNLSSKQIALANMRAKYTPLMEPTNKINQFELITRPKRVVSAGDREALIATVSEVEIFKDFLESYREN